MTSTTGNGEVKVTYRHTPRQGKTIYKVTLNPDTDNEKTYEGFSMKQIAYKYSEAVGSFNNYRRLLAKLEKATPVFHDTVSWDSTAEHEDERLADICDDLNCSVAEAKHFQKTGEHPQNW
tara:strand:- start:791 stop:1150 length:360 start_codon:yes stop_codon:yes gene_type:complete